MIKRCCALTMRAPRHQTLVFHRVLKEPDPLLPAEPDANWFESLIRQLSKYYEFITLDEAVRRAATGELSGRSLSVTFDDGYADNYEVALPVLERYRVPGMFFVTSGYLDGGIMWNDQIIETVRCLDSGPLPEVISNDMNLPDLLGTVSRREAAEKIVEAWKHLPYQERQRRVELLTAASPRSPKSPMMSSEQLCAMAASPFAEIGGHTRTHPILKTLSYSQARDEILGGKKDIEDIIQRPLKWFAYPNGKFGRDYDETHVSQAKRAGFEGAVSTNWGTLHKGSDVFQIPRFTPWSRSLERFFLGLARCHFGLV